jgi:hypothetical protein
MSDLHDDETAPGPVPDSVPFVVEPTGHRRIDDALERLEMLDTLPLSAHPEEFDALHQVLRASLASAGRDEDVTEPA